MKKMLRALLLCLALLMCLTPVLVACDPASEDGQSTTENGGEIDASSIEGKFVAKAPNQDKTLTLKLYQLEDTNGKDTVKCSLVLYKAADKSILNYQVFDMKVNGKDVDILSLDQTLWTEDHLEATIVDADGKKTVFTIAYQK